MPTTIALADGDSRLELVETSDGYYSAIRCRANDSTLWEALPPDGSRGDAWVSVTLQDGAVIANSWSGWRIQMDPTTGEEQARTFTK